jgi:hypothetical protein
VTDAYSRLLESALGALADRAIAPV